MKTIIFDAHPFEKETLNVEAQKRGHELTFVETRLDVKTAPLARGFPCVCAFVNDDLRGEVLEILKKGGTELIALRSAGFNHVALNVARKLGMRVVRVPEYSPYAVAEHAVALILCLNRKIHRAYNRVREGNFTLDGLVGFDLHGKTVGVIGTGKIGKVFIRIMKGFGVHVKAYDVYPDEDFARELGFSYTDLSHVISSSDILSLHLPLMKETLHLIDEKAMGLMRRGALLINTSRGKLVDTKALIEALKSGHLGGAGLDVYEEEENVFFQDHSFEVLADDILARLILFPNVILTSHQAFLTQEALGNIAETTFQNISDFEDLKPLQNEV